MSSKLFITIREELKNKVQKLADKKNISQAAMVSFILSEYFEKEEKNDKN